jgi:biotin synthase
VISLTFLIEKLQREHRLTHEEYLRLLEHRTPEMQELLAQKARAVCEKTYGKGIFLRGLVEVSSYCKQNCLYCGLRCENSSAVRYRLTEEEILSACRDGYALGYRTFVLQGGEDPYFTPQRVADLVQNIKQAFPQVAVTLSLGEASKETYALWRNAGADRYLLRHETANERHFALLHPISQTLKTRMQCIAHLRDLGYQVGVGMMIGSPHQTLEHLAEDLCFLQDFQPHMVGMGPFIPQKDTPFGAESAGSVDLTLYLLSIVRLMLPKVLLPATTALATLDEKGREKGILAGANVCMPNLTPPALREHYAIYDGKLSTRGESAQNVMEIKKQMEAIGFTIVESRGDYPQ